MTEQEREELIEQMANAIFASTHSNGRYTLANMARAALAVAEPVIREQCARIAEKSFGIQGRYALHIAAAIREGGEGRHARG